MENLKEDYISKEEYRRICWDKKVTDSESQNTLLKRLNDLGIMLNFKEHETEVLNPEWVTRGVYKVVTSAEVMKNKGILTQNLLKSELESLNDELRKEKKDFLCYPSEKYKFIIDLMKQFELTYQIHDTENFLIPALLPEDYTLDEDWDEKECLRFRYFYEKILLDEGIISRFIVKTQHLSHNQKHWLTGCLLKNDKGNLALIKANIPNKIIDIWIKGNEKIRREFLGIIKDYFESIHQDKKPNELIPLLDYENEFVNYQDLIVLERDARAGEDYLDKKVVQGKTIRFDIRDLLNGYSTQEERKQHYNEDRLNELKKHIKNRLDKTTHQNAKEIDDIVEPYLDDEKPVKKEQEKPSLFKVMATFAFLFIVILAPIGFYDYLQKQGYLSEKGFYLALVFTIVFIIVIGTFSLVYLGIIPPEKIPDILKPAFGLITGNQETKELGPKSENDIKIENKEPEKQLN